MSVWRQKAIDCLPEFKHDLEQNDTSIYDVFMYLREAVVEAHQQNNRERLGKLYGYAAWCYRQKEEKLWNAAGVAFYEHLGDHKETTQFIAQWVDYDIYKEIRELIKLRIGEQRLQELDKSYTR